MSNDVRIGVVGTGFIATHFMRNLDRHEGFVVRKVLTRRPASSLPGLPEGVATNSVDELVKDSDVIVECSGDPIWATEVASAAVSSQRPMVTMNTEFHITTGSAFVGEGLITEAEGDQPGCLAALHEDAKAMGFEPIAYGNMKGFLNPDPTVDDMTFWGEKQGISLPMVTSFTDGTKVKAEQILVGNHFGAGLAEEGMLGAEVDGIEEAAAVLAAAATRRGRPISDFVVDRSLPHGVFVVCEHDEGQSAALEYYKLGPGPYYTLIKNNIFVHLEILKTVRRMMDWGQILLDNSASPELSLAGVAKRPLDRGELIESAIGSFDVRGHAVEIEKSLDHVPMGLMQNVRVIEPLERGEVVTFEHLEVPDSLAVDLWRNEILPRTLEKAKAAGG